MSESPREISPEVYRCAQEVLETVPPVMRFIRSEMRRQSAPALSVPQFRVLAFLGRRPGCSLTGVAEFLGVTNATASTMVDRLVQHGLVCRESAPEERRRHILTLTHQGAGLLSTYYQASRERMAQALAVLSPEQLCSVEEGLAMLVRAIREGSSHDHA